MKIYKLSQSTQSTQANQIVSFDFDNTIFILDWDEENGYYKFDPKDPETPLGKLNQSIANLINQHHAQGWKTICVTSRHDSSKKQVENVIKKNGLPITEIYCTNGQDKVFTLKELGVSKHYDDDYHEIMMLQKAGIEGIKV
jgi:acid phosphatase class B